MSKLIIVGGYAEGLGTLEPLRDVVAHRYPNYSEIELMTLAEAIDKDSNNQFAKAVFNRVALTHSAGLLPFESSDIKPERIIACNAPLPMNIGRLVCRVIRKTAVMIKDDRPAPLLSTGRYTRAVIRERFSASEAYGDMIEPISAFDASKALTQKVAQGIPSTGMWTSDDRLFSPDRQQQLRMSEGGVSLLLLPGLHDDILTRPYEIIENPEFIENSGL